MMNKSPYALPLTLKMLNVTISLLTRSSMKIVGNEKEGGCENEIVCECIFAQSFEGTYSYALKFMDSLLCR